MRPSTTAVSVAWYERDGTNWKSGKAVNCSTNRSRNFDGRQLSRPVWALGGRHEGFGGHRDADRSVGSTSADDPLLGLPGELGDELEVSVVVQHREPPGLGGRCNQCVYE